MVATAEQVLRRQFEPISALFGDGSSRTSWWNRNRAEMRLALSLTKDSSDKEDKFNTLILGSGAVDPWECADEAHTLGISPEIVALDLDKDVNNINQRLANGEEVSFEDAESVFKNPKVKTVREVDAEVKVNEKRNSQINITEGGVSVSEQLRDTVKILEPMGVESIFDMENDESQKLIISNNLLNNLIFQSSKKGPDWDFTSYVNLFKKINALLTPDGIFEFVHNDEFFHDNSEQSTRNIKAVLEAAGFTVLAKTTTYVRTTKSEKSGKTYIDENAGFIVCKDKNMAFPDAENKFISTFGKLQKDYPEVNFQVGAGTYEGFLKTENQTNILLMKVGKDHYVWINLPGDYMDNFSKLAVLKRDKPGFHPDIMSQLA